MLPTMHLVPNVKVIVEITPTRTTFLARDAHVLRILFRPDMWN